MSGIIGSRFNIRGSGLVGSLGTDGQVFTSTGAGLSPAFEDVAGGGKLLQIVQATDTTSRTTTSLTMVTASSSLTVNITPASTSNKILVVLMLCGFGADTQNTNAKVTVKRGATDISPSSGFADNNVVSGGANYTGGGNSVLDSPNSTSQQTYQYYMQGSGGNTARVSNGGFSSLTCYEIGA